MSERGVFALDRGWFDHSAFAKEPFTEREAWAWLISEAAYKPRVKRVGAIEVSLQRGQLAASVRYLAERWDWSKSRVHRFLDRLKNRDMIRTDSGTGVIVVTLCNYDVYQRVSLPSGTHDGTDSGTAAGQQRDKREDRENREIGSTSLRSVERAPTRRKPETDVPEDIGLTEADVAYALSKGMSMPEVRAEAERCRDHHLKKGSRMRDWAAAWRTWVNSPYRSKPPPAGRMNGHTPPRDGYGQVLDFLEGRSDDELPFDDHHGWPAERSGAGFGGHDRPARASPGAYDPPGQVLDLLPYRAVG